jgi:tRNA (guanine9-N1)-methyltransferase
MKRLRKAQAWEEGKDGRRKRRKQKREDRRDRRREARDALIAQGIDPKTLFPHKGPSSRVPVALLLDCDFETYMMEKEIWSLASQITRAYSDNRSARYRSHLWVSGWKGTLYDRFHGVLGDQHLQWQGIGFVEGDFVEGAARAREQLRTRPGEIIEPLRKSAEAPVPMVRDATDPLPLPEPEPEPDEACRDIVYLTSDSPYTLERLEPNTIYVIGGLVDRNREKGLCYRRARERGIRTARLPIGQYMLMQSRKVLATNHVVEIMLKWLECEDWGQAFTSVIPKRKGGMLRREEASQGKAEAADAESSASEVGEEHEELDASPNESGLAEIPIGEKS